MGMMGCVPYFRSRVSPIGVDVGPCGLRMAQVTRGRGEYTVSALARVDARASAAEEELPQRLSACRAQAAFRGRSAVASLSAPQVSYFALELPPVGPAEQANIARFEIERLVADRAQEFEIRHWSVPRGRSGAPSALGLAAPRAKVEQVIGRLQRAALSCSRLDTGEAALCRLGTLLLPERSGGVWGILDFGRTHVRLVLCTEDIPVLVRVVGPGGEALTSRIAQSLGISEATAEVHKIEHGIAEASPGEEGRSEAEIGALHYSILRTELQAIAAEIKRSYEYVLSCYPGGKALDLILAGGGARLRNLDVFFAGALGIRVRCASSYLTEARCRLRFASGKSVALEPMAQAVGLAIED